ncbi:ABC transporter ATP-binding protein [Egbenema bharatensis]|uniref:ABC transporter ATP-binding protein n=1 Tax=Egbenema bharatensis TaxID=3463334 RepID=UPI003A8A7C6A
MSPSNKLLLRLALRYPVHIVVNILLGFSGALFNGVSTALIVPVFMSMLGQDAVLASGPPMMRQFLDLFDGIPAEQRLLAMAAVIIGFIVLKNLAVYASNLASNALGRKLTSDLQEEGIKLLLDVDLDYFTQAKAGDLMNRLGGEMNRASTTISTGISLVITVITIFVFVGLLVWTSWQLTIAATLLLPISPLISQFLIAKARHFGKRITHINQDYSGRLIEIFAGIRLVKAAATEQQEFVHLRRLIRDRERLEFQSRMAALALAPLSEITSICALFLLVLLGRILFANQIDAFSTVLLTYIVLLFRLLPFVAQLNGHRENIARSAASVDIVYDLMRSDNKHFMAGGSIPYTPICQEIRFEQVEFRYPGSSDLVLRQINLTIPKGTTLALVGSSGAGKTTLVDLLPRFYDPTQGSIKIDGIDLREFDLKTLRRSMGIVSQDTFLFNDTIRNNIAYGCPHVTNADVEDAVQRANAHEFIQRLPEGLDTMIGDRGVMLSGGQRQRIAIARALLRNPEILILDEATSALDTVSERLVQQALDDLSRERTTLVIAHRLSTVQKAHQIAVLDRGQVVELGTHQELLQKNGLYSRLHAMQFADTPQPRHQEQQDQTEILTQASYEFRSHLNAMIGSLSLLADATMNPSEEQSELVEEAYRSATELFKTVKYLEDRYRGLVRSNSKHELSTHFNGPETQDNLLDQMRINPTRRQNGKNHQ